MFKVLHGTIDANTFTTIFYCSPVWMFPMKNL